VTGELRKLHNKKFVGFHENEVGGGVLGKRERSEMHRLQNCGWNIEKEETA
jgi:hypothetical protein